MRRVNKNLLEVSGDILHMITNGVKRFFETDREINGFSSNSLRYLL